MKKLFSLIVITGIGLFSTSVFADAPVIEITPEKFPQSPVHSQANQADDACGTVRFLLKDKQYDQAVLVLESLIKDGESCAEYQLGRMYVDGLGVARNREKGTALINSAEQKGYKGNTEY